MNPSLFLNVAAIVRHQVLERLHHAGWLADGSKWLHDENSQLPEGYDIHFSIKGRMLMCQLGDLINSKEAKFKNPTPEMLLKGYPKARAYILKIGHELFSTPYTEREVNAMILLVLDFELKRYKLKRRGTNAR